MHLLMMGSVFTTSYLPPISTSLTGCLAIFVLLCLNPKQILMLFALYTQLFYASIAQNPEQTSVLKENVYKILAI